MQLLHVVCMYVCNVVQILTTVVVTGGIIVLWEPYHAVPGCPCFLGLNKPKPSWY